MPKQINNLDYEEYKRKLLEDSERDDLSELQQKYANVDEPDYDNMNLHDELQTRLELRKMNELQQKYPSQYAQNNLANTVNNTSEEQQRPAYIFSPEMREALAMIESSNNYQIANKQGALGKYQLMGDGLVDIGYMRKDKNKKYHWLGKNDISSTDDFLNNPKIQEEALDEFMKSKYSQLEKCGAFNYLGKPLKGVENDFNITNTGLLAAAHRMGASSVCNYLNNLDINGDNKYYMDYSKLKPKVDKIYRAIERRMRLFEK